ncbi:acetyl esterase [Salirhabdus euzebyi]|uniref:Acetyl esterase n=1 Tax=Salirhabdus euzebyi TaxID=394506 RepID=A0A841Q5Z0_9BACI|nr:alpha/beta hydrolase [Salirhabdus euzebyi]MBB6453732.1 acetyl esterase [Salirhabdus euzebyi]
MTVNPGIQFFLDKLAELPKVPMEMIPAQVYREKSKEMMEFPQEAPEEVRQVENRVLNLEGRDIPVRVYTPAGEEQATYPGLVYYHGGGWVIGDLDSHDPICRLLANRANCVVVSVDYRLAPENKFPAAVEDAYDSLVYVSAHAEEFKIDPNRIAVGGDSAGGNLATVACIIAKEKQTPSVIHQLLLYPATGRKEEYPSLLENGEGYFLTMEMMNWFSKHYFNDESDYQHPHASPIFYPDLSGLPPATILTAQYDPLRDEGKAYADELEAQGVEVTFKNYEDLIHGFANFIGFVPAAKEAMEEVAGYLRDRFEAVVK